MNVVLKQWKIILLIVEAMWDPGMLNFVESL